MKKEIMEFFKDTRVRIASGVIAVLVVLLGVLYTVNPSGFRNLFGFSGIGQMGDYVVNEGVTSLPIYYSISDLKTGDSTKAGYIMKANELFGLDGFVGEDGLASSTGTYAKINFYSGEGGLNKSWVGYITRTQLNQFATKEGATPPPVTTFTVTFDSDGGTSVQSQTVSPGGKVTAVTSTRTGYTLEGWYNGTTKWNFSTNLVSSNITLKANWTATVVTPPVEPPVDETTISIKTVTGNPTNWTNQNVVLTVSEVNLPAGAKLHEKAYRFDSQATAQVEDWVSLNTATFTSNQEVKIYVRDTTGKISPVRVENITKIDKVAPTCVSSGGRTTWTRGNVDIIGTCTDTGGSGCKEATVKNPYSVNTNTTTATPGKVSDNAGNVVDCPANQTVKIDKDPVKLTVTKYGRILTSKTAPTYSKAFGYSTKCSGRATNLKTRGVLGTQNLIESEGRYLVGWGTVKIEKGLSPVTLKYRYTNNRYRQDLAKPENSDWSADDKSQTFNGYYGTQINMKVPQFENTKVAYVYISFPIGTKENVASLDNGTIPSGVHYEGRIQANVTNTAGFITNWVNPDNLGSDNMWNFDWSPSC